MERRIRPRRRRLWTLGLVAASLVLLSACGGAPSAASDRIEPSQLGDVPVPAGASPSGPPVVNGSVTTRTFRVTGLTPERTVDFYVTNGPSRGWDVDTPPHRTGTTDWQVVLRSGSRSLTVSSAPWTGQAGGGEDVSELTIMVER